MASNPLRKLQEEGVSVWLDYLDRKLMSGGRLDRLIEEDGIRGETSNPTIFQMGVSTGEEYAGAIRALAAEGQSAEEICWEIMIADVKRACDIFRPLYDESAGAHGYVSLELNPSLARDTDESLRQGRALWKRVDRANLMLKVPGTVEGLPVVEELLFEGMNINVTLLFAVRRYEEVIDAFFRALERRAARGERLDRIASVASFFVSRVDTEADRRLDALVGADRRKAAEVEPLRGKIAVANSRLAYAAFLKRFGDDRWSKLRERGARPQSPLWASTSTKNRAYRDVLYVEELIGPHCVNTIPDETIDAFRRHGTVRRTLTSATIDEARTILGSLDRLGIDRAEITEEVLVREGVAKFEKSYDDLLGTISRVMEA